MTTLLTLLHGAQYFFHKMHHQKADDIFILRTDSSTTLKQVKPQATDSSKYTNNYESHM